MTRSDPALARFRAFSGLVRWPTSSIRPGLRLGSLVLEIELAFSTQPLLRQLLGLDVLQHLRLGLDQRAREMFLAPRS